MDWISVEDRLPELHIDVLVYQRGDSDVWFIDTNYRYSGGAWSEDYEVSHWMPLPEPPT